MTYESFTVDGTEYWLFLGNHATQTLPTIESAIGSVHNLDVLVLEAEKIMSFFRPSDPQYGTIYDEYESRDSGPILYSVDAASLPAAGFEVAGLAGCLGATYLASRTKEKTTRRQFLRLTGYAGMGVLLGGLGSTVVDGISTEECSSARHGLVSLQTTMLPTFSGFRDALCAKILEEYIVPREKAEERDRVGIVYGSRHAGIRECLGSRRKREIMLKTHRPLSTVREAEMNVIERLEWTEDNFHIETIDTGLF